MHPPAKYDNTIEHNKKRWNEFQWEEKGEHWSSGWGNSDAQWNFCVRPRVAKFLPSPSIVEIATGYGRWTKYIINECESFTGIDLVEKCADYCSTHYGGLKRSFFANDGLHLTGVPDGSIDFVFSMDSLVHVDWPTLWSYLAETLRVLGPTGSAMIHHSNAADVDSFAELDPPRRKAFRAPDVSAALVREAVADLGGGVYAQELIDWGGSGEEALIDCFTIIQTTPAETKIHKNPKFMKDMRRIAELSELYS